MSRRFDAVLFDMYGTLVDERGAPMKGASELLHSLGNARWAIVTSMPRQMAVAVIGSARFPMPPVLVGADDVPQTKPDPACYQLAAKRLGVQPERCLVLEDTNSGIAAARGAGCQTIDVRLNRIARIQLKATNDFIELEG